MAKELNRAIATYLAHAYDGSPPPGAVRGRLESLSAFAATPFDCPVMERSTGEDPPRFSLRLGNRFYPHMKLVVERAPDGLGHLFRADTHDRHIQPAPNSKEAEAFRELMAKNQSLAEAIEAAWEAENLATFKQFLRNDLARRRGLQGQ